MKTIRIDLLIFPDGEVKGVYVDLEALEEPSVREIIDRITEVKDDE